MVLAHRSFVEAEPRFECKRHVTMDIRRPNHVFARRQTVGAGIVEIFENLRSDVFAVVPILEERLRIGGVDRSLVPRNRSEGLHLADVEQCPEEAAHAFVMIENLARSHRVAHVVQIVVDRTQLRPVARGPVGRVVGRIVVHEIGGLTVPRVRVGILVAVDEALDRRGETADEAVGIDFERRFVGKIVFALDFVRVFLCQVVFTRG